MTTIDSWRVLGISRGSSEDAIRLAFRRLAKRLHPDVNGGDAAKTDEFIRARLAYESLLTELRPKKQRKPPRVLRPIQFGDDFQVLHLSLSGVTLDPAIVRSASLVLEEGGPRVMISFVPSLQVSADKIRVLLALADDLDDQAFFDAPILSSSCSSSGSINTIWFSPRPR